MSEQVFRFAYTIFRIEAHLTKDYLSAKMGIRQVHVPLARLHRLFLDDRRERDSVELLVSYYDRKKRLKRARIFSDHGEEGLTALVEAMCEGRPDLRLQGLSAQEAYVAMGSKPRARFAIPALMLAAYSLVVLLCTPLFIHGWDKGQMVVDVRAVDLSAQLGTRNLVVTGGGLRFDHALHEVATQGADPGLARVWVPLVGPDWEPAKPIRVVLKTRARHMDALRDDVRFEGILRNVWWEGLSGRTIRLLKEAGSLVSPQTWLIESGVHSKDERALVYLILGALAIPLLGVSAALWGGARSRGKRRR